jgi:anti-sigma factor RsiW
MAMIDYSADLYDPVYSIIGVPATLTVGTAGEIALTVIDETRRKTQTSNGVEVRSVGPAAFARVPELDGKGIAREAYKGSVLTFNGRSWTVRHYDLTGSPNGEDFGEVLFQLMAMS